MNMKETLEMLDKWKKLLEFSKRYPVELNRDEIEQVIILLRSYLMTFEKDGYPFD